MKNASNSHKIKKGEKRKEKDRRNERPSKQSLLKVILTVEDFFQSSPSSTLKNPFYKLIEGHSLHSGGQVLLLVR